jgi:hypothetical protein
MDAEIISLGIKRIVIPVITNHIIKNFEPKDKVAVIDERLKRLENFNGGQQLNVAEVPEVTTNTHVSPPSPTQNDVAVSCVECARAHLATISGSLKEAVRFARDDGVLCYEVQTRLSTSEEEIAALERYDWTPEKIVNSPEEEQQVINEFLPRVRRLRQDIIIIHTLVDLVKCAADAGNIHNEYRIKIITMKVK